MKKLKISVLALAVLAFGACTSDDNLITDGGGSNSLTDGNAYLCVSIHLPTEASTRATTNSSGGTTNDNFADGLQSEYTVNDVTLLLFGGASETTALFSKAYPLKITTQFPEQSSSTGNNITETGNWTLDITRPNGDNVYALAVLNGEGILDNLSNPTSLGGVSLDGATIGDLQTHIYTPTDNSNSVSAFTSDGFFMTNAPLSSKVGGSSSPSGTVITTLADVTENVSYSQSEAADNPTDIYVERGVAKVTVTDATGGQTSIASNNVRVSLLGFALDNTNTKTYVVRNTTTDNTWWTYRGYDTDAGSYISNYRFVGSANTGGGYRTYWALDPNYDEGFISGDLYTRGGGTLSTYTSLGESTPAYCFENTFNVTNMNNNQTTRAIIVAKLNNGTSFYCINGNTSTIYSSTEAQNYVKSVYMGITSVSDALSKYTGGDFSSHLTVTLGTTASTDAGATLSISGVTASNFSDNTLPAVFTAGTSEYNSAMSIIEGIELSYYAGGLSYYPVYIKHFGDDLTPWDEDYASDQEESYPGSYNETWWLGRYGVLRNNWYDLQVSEVKSIGYAVIPEADNTPDDPLNQYISVDINVLSWAKRTQSVDL
ncbi:MAG: Mfa1 family fimbria major subunit [Prevotella sp.]|nr:Mfa1 family fimbria major subunit [Prevotella sp.]